MSDSDEDYFSKSDATDSVYVTEDFSEYDDVVNHRKRIKKFFSLVVLMYVSDCQTEFPRWLLYGPVKVCRAPVIEWKCSFFLLTNVVGCKIIFQLSVKLPVE